MPELTVADKIAALLTPYLGPFNSKIAIKTFAKKALNLEPEEIEVTHVPKLLEALRPMLHTLIGRESTNALIKQIQRGVG